MSFIPTRFWVTTGSGESNTSKLNAIDEAYLNAGIGYQNHVLVSSIPPVKEIYPAINSESGITIISSGKKKLELPPSSILHVVRSLKTGEKGDIITSCIALAKIKSFGSSKNNSCLLAFENSGTNLDKVQKQALDGVGSMIKSRSAELDDTWENSGYKIISKELHISKKYGCVVSFVVLDPFTYI